MSAYDYYGDECDDSEDDSYVGFPSLVQEELDRRMDDPSITEPASDEIIALVRQFFQEGGDAALGGGYLDLVEQLGVTPSTKDQFVKNVDYNIFRFLVPRLETQEESEEKWSKLYQNYRNRVRLLRYQEFIDFQTAAGLGFDPIWSVGAENLDSHPLKGFNNDEDDKDSNTESKLDDEFDMTTELIMGLASWCQAGGFYYYVNHDKIFVGLAVGQKNVTDLGDKCRSMEFDFSQDTLMDQANELHDRYRKMQCPLAPKAQFVKKTKNSKRKKAGGLGSHAIEMKKITENLIISILNLLTPTCIMAQYLGSVVSMLQVACEADEEVAKTLIQVTSVLTLRKKALKYAKQADSDMEGRPGIAAAMWWQTYECLTRLIGDSIRCGHQIDSELASGYFLNHVEEALLTSIKSSYAAERFSALKVLPEIMWSLQSNSICLRFLKHDEKWQLLQDACAVDAFEDKSSRRNYREQKRQTTYATFAAKEAIGFFCAMGQFGMKDAREERTSGVRPGKASVKLIQKGIVPLLLTIAASDCLPLSSKALMGLAHLSRVKDCRVLIWQEPHTVELIHKCLNSSDLQQVSETMLLVVHLLWDEEEAPKLTSLTDPPLQKVAIKWAAFNMRQIIDRAHMLRKSAQEQNEKRASECLEALSGANLDPISKEKANQVQEDFFNEKKASTNWLECESDDFRGDAYSCALCRSILVLVTMHGQDPEPLLKVNALHLVSCCIDVPCHDHHHGAATLLINILARRGAEDIVPEMFPDPDHLIVSLVDRVKLCLEAGRQNGQSMNGKSEMLVFLTARLFAAKAWKACFRKVAESDETRAFWIHNLISKCDYTRANAAGRERDDGRQQRPAVLQGCNSLTGKLKTCEKCGKLESKAKEFKACARCGSAYYCKRECQKSHWKLHKKTCKAPEAS